MQISVVMVMPNEASCTRTNPRLLTLRIMSRMVRAAPVLRNPAMQKILIALLALTTTVGAWLAVQYHSQLTEMDARNAALTAERDAARAAEKAALAAADPLRENIDRLTRERDRLQAQAKMQPQNPGPGGPVPPGAGGPNSGTPGIGGMMAMMQTPEGRKMLQNQAASKVQRQYSELAKRMKLSPQDTTVLMGLLADRQTALTTARMNSAGNPAQAAADTSAIQSEFADKLKSTFGEEGFGQFNEYDKSVDERSAVNQFEDQFKNAGTPLDSTQKESLVQLLASEREKSPENPFDPSKNDPTAVLNALKSETALSTWEKQQQDYKDRVLQAATKTLTPDQVSTLKQTLDQKTERQKAGLQVFKTTGVPPPPPQQR